jgi:hypothetical protein
LQGDALKDKNSYEWLKPYCVEKWKKFVKERKAMRYAIFNMNKMLNSTLKNGNIS